MIAQCIRRLWSTSSGGSRRIPGVAAEMVGETVHGRRRGRKRGTGRGGERAILPDVARFAERSLREIHVGDTDRVAIPDLLARKSHLTVLCQSIAPAKAALARASAAFASKATIVGDCRETVPTFLPSPSMMFTFAVGCSQFRTTAAMTRPSRPVYPTHPKGLSSTADWTRVLNGVTSALGTERSQSHHM